MRANDIMAVKTLIANIDNSIKSRDVNSGIKYYNLLRNYAINPNIDTDIRRFAYEKGKELHSILAQMSSEIINNQKKISTTAKDTSKVNNSVEDKIITKASKTFKNQYRLIVISIIILTLLIVGSLFFINKLGLSDNNTIENYQCNISEPFTCKETALDTLGSINKVAYVILGVDQTSSSINNIKIVSTSESLSKCSRIYLDEEYYKSKNYNEIKIVLECNNMSLSKIYSGLLLEYQSAEGINNRILSIGREGLTNMFVIEQVSSPVPGENLENKNTTLDIDTTCNLFPENLESCTQYSCEFTHPFSEESMTRTILGINGTACHYIEEMPYNGTIECHYDFNTRTTIAQFYKDIVASGKYGNNNFDMYNTNLVTIYDMNGKMVSNPMQEALIIGQCVVSGYKMSANIPECPIGTTYIGEKYYYENDTKVTEIICSDLAAE